MEISVAVYDDNSSRRESLEMLIESTPGLSFAGAWPDCQDVIQNFTSATSDVILMDINMPNVDGIEGVRKLRKHFPEVKIIIQTVFEDNEKIFEAICAGANGYILKQSNPAELISAIFEVKKGGAPMTPSIANKVLGLISGRTKLRKDVDFSLTKREHEILKLLVKGYSYNMIAEECNISYPTVNTHITNIYSKLQVKSVASAVSRALKDGLV